MRTAALAICLAFASVACSESNSAEQPDAAVENEAAAPHPNPGTRGIASPLPDAGEPVDSALPVVGAPTLEKFVTDVTRHYCDRVGECCLGGDLTRWDTDKCIAGVLANGGVKQLGVHLAATLSGAPNVHYEPARASACLVRVRGMSCFMDDYSYQDIRETCYAALRGTIPLNGKGCTDSIECAAGRCDEHGACVALVPKGGVCTTTADCSYRGAYEPALFCDNDPARTPTCPTCAAQLPVGASCGGATIDREGACQSGICGPDGKCATGFMQTDGPTCAAYTKPKSGT